MSEISISLQTPFDAVFGEFQKLSVNELIFYCKDVVRAKQKLISFLMECKNSQHDYQMISALLIKKFGLENDCINEETLDQYANIIKNDEYSFQLDEFQLFAQTLKSTIILFQKNESTIVYNDGKEDKIYIFFNGVHFYRMFPAKDFNPLGSNFYLQIVFMSKLFYVYYPFKGLKENMETYTQKLKDFDKCTLHMKNVFELSDAQILDLINQNEENLEMSLKNLIQEVGVFLMKDDPTILEKKKAKDGSKIFFVKNKTKRYIEIGFSHEGNYMQIKLTKSKLIKELEKIYKKSYSKICSEDFMAYLIQNDLIYELEPDNKLYSCTNRKMQLRTSESGLFNQLMQTKTNFQLVLDTFKELFLSLEKSENLLKNKIQFLQDLIDMIYIDTNSKKKVNFKNIISEKKEYPLSVNYEKEIRYIVNNIIEILQSQMENYEQNFMLAKLTVYLRGDNNLEKLPQLDFEIGIKKSLINHKDAFEKFAGSAKSNYSISINALAKCYEDGLGIQQNFLLAIQNYEIEITRNDLTGYARESISRLKEQEMEKEVLKEIGSWYASIKSKEAAFWLI